jgi:hypothetical protein
VKHISLAFLLATTLFGCQTTKADILISFSDADFASTDTFNIISQFNFNFRLDEDLVAGGVYNDPNIKSLDYFVRGDLRPQGSPSGFPGFALSRSMDGSEFYNLSPESSFSFSVSSTADLSDGLQLSELVDLGGGEILRLNAREFDQNPGRYHPPIFTLKNDGTGVLWNANNKSQFINPGSGRLVDVAKGEEYISDLTFNPSAVTFASVPEPGFMVLLGLGLGGLSLLRNRRKNGS